MSSSRRSRRPQSDNGVIRVVAHDRFAHHGAHSGYVQVLPHLAAQSDVRLVELPLAPRGLRALTEFARVRRATKGAAPELHLYPEQTLFPRRDRGRVVAVCHQPARRYTDRRAPRDLLLRASLARCAGIVALGPNQADGLRSMNRQIEVVPHGVDVDWFSPGGSHAGDSFVVVRGWLRDLDRQRALTDLARAQVEKVVEVGGGATRLSDEQYRDALRSSRGVLLWIPDGVASNAVLEAASSGKPVLGRLSPDLQSYVSPANRGLLQLEPEAQLAVPAERLVEVGAANREQVLAQNAWPTVAERLVAIAGNWLEAR